MSKKKLHQLHGWLGFTCLIPFILISLTGSLLVFKKELDVLLMPTYTQVIPSDTRLSENALIDAINNQLPEYELGSWEILGQPSSAMTEADRIYLIRKGTDNWFKAHLNPFTGEVISPPVALNHYLTDWLLELHYTLLLNDIEGLDKDLGTAFTSLFALILIFLGISGLVIYRHFWRRVFTLRWNSRLLVVFSDVHKMAGTLASPILLILGITGGYYNIAIYVHEWQEHQDGHAHHQMAQKLYNKHLDFDRLFSQAANHIPGFETTYVLMPSEPNQPITLYGKTPTENPLISDYASTVSFNAQSGGFIGAYDIRDQAFVPVLIDTFRKLHFGNFAGYTSQIIWAFFGFMPVLLASTGGYIWLRRRSKRRK
ncbi:PepSY domain-containing protein [Pseudoalteromonas sp. SMS1]|uniref:PepSY-associated TM helix domain-containing protein n=1 Tax=Pseudoalteromonas sp. SMS1 TaxID=2908894 RepID=UPI001F46528E|nr:PepSY-associated TM helix domain-containing protein [Pseudoalteromonas sp. SMS1]MCF2859767.1 PepSY domain-containing protein [Pseudoalteromonas sp. SMS1]